MAHDDEANSLTGYNCERKPELGRSKSIYFISLCSTLHREWPRLFPDGASLPLRGFESSNTPMGFGERQFGQQSILPHELLAIRYRSAALNLSTPLLVVDHREQILKSIALRIMATSAETGGGQSKLCHPSGYGWRGGMLLLEQKILSGSYLAFSTANLSYFACP
jgi:hypothetical protein